MLRSQAVNGGGCLKCDKCDGPHDTETCPHFPNEKYSSGDDVIVDDTLELEEALRLSIEESSKNVKSVEGRAFLKEPSVTWGRVSGREPLCKLICQKNADKTHYIYSATCKVVDINWMKEIRKEISCLYGMSFLNAEEMCRIF